ncbi:MAG: DUF1015 family protein [candidate division Zixibacteria bacterium]|nr:DUF1015 family protein [candidate division Zixibacteria bacterium]
MSVIRPFKGLRPRPDMAAVVASPPYDVLNSDEARALVKDNPNSFLRVNKPEVDFKPGVSMYSDEVYLRGKENLQRLADDNIMLRDQKPCFYLYRLTWKGQSQTGLVTLTSCEEYEQGTIKKHEHTRPVKVNDRADHIQKVAAQVGPVFSIFRDNPDIKAIFAGISAAPPEYDFTTEDDVRHEMWVINDSGAINVLVAAFGKLDAIYIADGHHRSAAASEVARRMKEQNPNHTGNEYYNFFLNVIFPDSELRILPYNRVVKGLNGMTADAFVARLKDAFDVTPLQEPLEPKNPYCFGTLCQGNWFRLTAKPGTFDANHPADSIDAAVLTSNLLGPVLGIEDIRTDKNIDFIGGIRGVAELEKLVNSGDFDLAFSLYPVTVTQLLAVADAGQVMPPKSTWFEPKLRSGMVVNLLDE